jgi:hypothetical protein
MMAAALALPVIAVVPAAAVAAMLETPRGEVRRSILDALRVPVSRELRQPVEFVVEKIVQSGNWAFVIATPQRPGGRGIDWQSTICDGDVSHLVGGLLRREGGQWSVKALALCPTDVAWEPWPGQYGAPAELFQ